MIRVMNSLRLNAAWFLGCALLSLPLAASAQSPGSVTARSCRQFTQQFYDWYVPFTRKGLSGPAWDLVLQRRANSLSPQLYEALKNDSASQAKGELVGLDYDPFLNTQEPAVHYETGAISWVNGKCTVEVWRSSKNETAEKSDKPALVAELEQHNQRWRFTDFIYPTENTDLLKQLEQLKKARTQP